MALWVMLRMMGQGQASTRHVSRPAHCPGIRTVRPCSRTPDEKSFTASLTFCQFKHDAAYVHRAGIGVRRGQGRGLARLPAWRVYACLQPQKYCRTVQYGAAAVWQMLGQDRMQVALPVHRLEVSAAILLNQACMYGGAHCQSVSDKRKGRL